MNFYRRTGKRLMDMTGALIGLTLLFPVFVLLAFAIWIEDRGQILFRQKRVGKNDEEFILLKFRSMPVGTPDIPSSSAAALRFTYVGRALRRTNMDELPQLINVLRGEMSLVGPRPALPVQKDVIELRKRNDAYRIKPGLTGLAQVNSYDGMTAEEKAEWDGIYSKEISFLCDLKVIIRTFGYLLKPPPVY